MQVQTNHERLSFTHYHYLNVVVFVVVSYRLSFKNKSRVGWSILSRCGQYMKALNLYLDWRARDGSCNEVVGKARSDMPTHTLIDYLMGERDGEPKIELHLSSVCH